MFKPYIKCFLVEIDKGKEYYASFLSSLLYLPISLLVYYFLFRYLMHGSGSSAMTLHEILSYYTVVLFLKSAFQHTMAEVYYVFQDINRGYLDIWITKPTNYLLSRYFRAIGSVSLTVPTSLLILIILFWGRHTLEDVLWFFLAILQGFTLLFLVMFLLGSLTFWLKSVLTLRDIFWGVLSVFSGELIPLDLLPTKFRFLQSNPLACIYDIPYKVLNVESSLRFRLLGMQIINILFLGILATILWNFGVKHYESHGG